MGEEGGTGGELEGVVTGEVWIQLVGSGGHGLEVDLTWWFPIEIS